MHIGGTMRKDLALTNATQFVAHFLASRLIILRCGLKLKFAASAFNR